MTKTKKRRWSLKSAATLFLAGVMLVGEAAGVGPATASTVYAAEETTETVTSMEYYDNANGPTVTKSGIDETTFWIVAPKFNGKSYKELDLSQVWNDLAFEVKQEDGSWMNIDQKYNPNSPYKWSTDWGMNLGEGWDNYGFWIVVDKTTDMRIRSKTSNAEIQYHLVFNQLERQTITSISTTETNQNATATGQSWIHFNLLTINGTSPSEFVHYQQYEDDLEMLVDNKDGKGFVALSANPDSGFIWGQNFDMWYDGAGGIFFTGVYKSFTVRFQSKTNPNVGCEFNVNYSEATRTDYTLSVNGNGNAINTNLDANTNGNVASVGLVLPYIGGIAPYQKDLDKFVYEIQTESGWINLAAAESGWVYQGNGYSKYSDKQQWGYSASGAWGLWFQPVLTDTVIRVGYPENGEKGGAINDNYVTYTIIGNPNGIVPDVADMVDIEVDKSAEEPTNDNVQESDITTPEGWEMVWHDEFNGTSLDSSKWANQTGFLLLQDDITTAGWGNNELEHYTDSEKNTSVGDGKLKLTMLPDEKDFYSTDGQKATAKYSSGKILTKDKFSVKYGRIDFRAKLPAGTGVWPAMWMMPNDDIYGTWAASGEIDVFEGKGRVPEMAYGTLHYGNMSPGNKNTGDFINMVENGNVKSDFTNWHVYSVVWEEGNIKMYADGKCYFKCTSETFYSGGAGGNVNAPFDQRFYLIINLAAGGWFDGGTVPDENFEKAEMYVDYVRVYQKPVGEDEDEKPDSAELEAAGKTKHASVGKDDNLYGDYSIGVQIPLEKMTLDKTSISIPAGYSEKITPSFEPANATNKNITWTSSDESVATVSGGEVTGIKPGTATITAVAEDGEIEKTCTVEVTGDNVTAIEVNPTALVLTEGETGALTATVTGTNQNVTWTSSDESVAAVDEHGIVTAKKAGTTTITVTSVADITMTATCAVTINAKPTVDVTGVTIKNGDNESGEVTLEQGKTVTLSANVMPSDATDKSVTWTSGNDTVATVDANGKVTAVGVGITTITVKANGAKEGETITDTWNVIVTKKSAERTDYGIERRGNDVVFYLKTTTKPDAFYIKLDSADQQFDQSQVGAKPITQNGDYYECIIEGAASDENAYYACYFNSTVNDKIIMRVGDMPIADDGSESPVNIPINSVSITNAPSAALKIGDTLTLRASVLPLDATVDREVTWKSSNTDVVTVDENGKVEAVGAGTATITATSVSDNSKTATCDITVAASHTVTFKDGEETLSTQVVATGGTVTKPSDPTKEGYTFAGWLMGDNAFDFDTTITGDTTLTAKWEEIKVSQIQMSAKIQLMEGVTTTITPTVIPSNALDTSLKWESSDESVATVDENGKITAIKAGTATVTATNESSGMSATCTVNVGAYVEETSLYQVDFVVNGSTIKTIKVQENSLIKTEDIPQVTEEGYTFEGWYEGNTEFNFDTSKITKYTTLVAKLTRHVESIQLNKSAMTLEEGASETLSAIITPTDATDKSVTWTSSDSTIAEVDSNGKVTAKAIGDATITATSNADSSKKATCKITVTEKTIVLEEYTVAFDSAGGSDVESQTVKDGSTAIKPEDPTKEGYTFAGWYLNDAEYDFSSAVNNNITLTAKWEADNKDDGGEDETTVSVTGVRLNKAATTLEAGASETLTATIAPENASNKNVTWKSSDKKIATVDGGKVTAVAAGETIIAVTTADGNYTAICKVTVTAPEKPVAKDYTVTFDSAQGSAVDSQTVKEGEKAVKPEDPARAGYRFMGWYTGETEYSFDTAVNADVTLTAKWKVIEITKIKVTAISNKIAAGKKVQLKVSLSPTDAVAKSVTWKLAKKSDSKYATVKSNGKVTLKKSGAGKSVKVKVTVTGLDGSTKTKTIKITIKKHAVKKLAIKGNKTYSVKAGRSVNLKSKVKITTTGKSVNKTLSWTTSDKEIATVSKNGKVKVSKTAKKGQKVKIKAQSTDGTNKKVIFTIKVK